METKQKPRTKYRYRCPYCNRAYKSARGLTAHRRKGSQPGWCHAMGTKAAQL